MKQKIIFTILLLLFSLSTMATKDQVHLKIVKAVLQSKVSAGKGLTINGQTYPYRMNREKSDYNDAGDEDCGQTFEQLRTGKEYFFNVLSSNRKKDKNAIITFVAKREPYLE